MADFFIENYGCQMNAAEADSIRSLLVEHGHREAQRAESADLILINTCSVRTTAEDRIRGRLGFYRALKAKSEKKFRLVVMGCMSQNLGRSLCEEYSGLVDAVWGTYHKDTVLEYIANLDKPRDSLDQTEYRFLPPRPEKKYPFRAFVPISHGCENFCSYCIVPAVRGPEIHRPAEDILRWVRDLAERGVVEVTLLGQNVNSWRENGLDFPELLDRIARETGIPRLSFLTSHPKDLSDNLLGAVRDNNNVMKSLHLPMQSGNNRILSLMNRKYAVERYLEIARKALSIPGLTLSTDIIAGFPGESESEFEDTLQAVRTVRFHQAFMYYYNVRPGTAAARMEDTVPVPVKKERLARLIDLQNAITRERLAEQAGRPESFLAESVSRKNRGEVAGRTHNGLMMFVAGNREMIGKIHPVEVTGASGNGLTGRVRISPCRR